MRLGAAAHIFQSERQVAAREPRDTLREPAGGDGQGAGNHPAGRPPPQRLGYGPQEAGIVPVLGHEDKPLPSRTLGGEQEPTGPGHICRPHQAIDAPVTEAQAPIDRRKNARRPTRPISRPQNQARVDDQGVQPLGDPPVHLQLGPALGLGIDRGGLAFLPGRLLVDQGPFGAAPHRPDRGDMYQPGYTRLQAGIHQPGRTRLIHLAQPGPVPPPEAHLRRRMDHRIHPADRRLQGQNIQQVAIHHLYPRSPRQGPLAGIAH